jgi:Tol biopolymer transport system component
LISAPTRGNRKSRVFLAIALAILATSVAVSPVLLVRPPPPLVSPTTGSSSNPMIPVQMTNGRGNDTAPVFSPDGQTIAFSSNSRSISSSQIWTMSSSDGSHLVAITALKGNATDPQWSADGRKIAFLEIERGHSELWVVNKDGSGLTEVTQNNLIVNAFAWSPKTDLLVYSVMQEGKWQIAFYPSGNDGSSARKFQCPEDHDCYFPYFSSDGRSIVFVESSGSGQSLVVADIGNGTTRQILPSTPNVNITSPKFSMDDKYVFFLENSNTTFSSNQGSSKWDILSVSTYSTSGSSARSLLSAPPGGTISPTWQPTVTQDCSFGQRPNNLTEILLSAYSVSDVSDLFLVEENATVIQWAGAFWFTAPGTIVARLSNLSYSDIRGLAWSSDGNRIVYSAATNGTTLNHIYIMAYVPPPKISVYQR